jgi:hypothetical protein
MAAIARRAQRRRREEEEEEADDADGGVYAAMAEALGVGPVRPHVAQSAEPVPMVQWQGRGGVLLVDTALPGGDGRKPGQTLADCAVPHATGPPQPDRDRHGLRAVASLVPAPPTSAPAGLRARRTAVVRPLRDICLRLVAANMDAVASLRGVAEAHPALAHDLLARALPGSAGSSVPLYLYARYAECFGSLAAVCLRNWHGLGLARVAALGDGLTTLALDQCELAPADLGALVRCRALRWLSVTHNQLDHVGPMVRPYDDPSQRRTRLCRLAYLDMAFNALPERQAHLLLLRLGAGRVVLTGNPIDAGLHPLAREAGYVRAPGPDRASARAHTYAALPLDWPADAVATERARGHDAVATALHEGILHGARRISPADARALPYRDVVYVRVAGLPPLPSGLLPPVQLADPALLSDASLSRARLFLP